MIDINNRIEQLILDAGIKSKKYRISVRDNFNGGLKIYLYITVSVDNVKITKLALDIFDLDNTINKIVWDINSPSRNWNTNEQDTYVFNRNQINKMKQLIGENILTETNWPSLSISDVLDKLLNFADKTLIFFDTETLGLNPEKDYIQLTQLGVIVVDGSTMKEKKIFNIKIKFNKSSERFLKSDSKERKDWERSFKNMNKTPNEILDMTGYFNDLPEKLATEEQALKILKHIISNSKNPILIAHNAKFDMRFINVRSKKYNIIIPRVSVLDTLKLSQFFLIPTLQALNNSEILDKLRKVKEIKLSDVKSKNKNPNNKFERFTSENGTEMLRIIYGHPSASLGKLTDALIGKIENWHDALADVRSMILILNRTIEILTANRNVDLTKFIGLMVKHLKNRDKWLKSRGFK